MPDFSGLPGETLVRRGLGDLAQGTLSPEALTLSLAVTRLQRMGIEIPGDVDLPENRELALYSLLGETGCDDPYHRYNSLRRELDSFLEALEGRARRGRTR